VKWRGCLDNICLSGGAIGADYLWGEVASMFGHQIVHFGFAGHRSKVPRATIYTLTEEALLDADPYLVRANKTLDRRWPVRDHHVASLLRRNFYQVIETDSVYAVASLDRGHVAGGTAWAVQMYLDRFDRGVELPCYVFDQNVGTWTQWDGDGFLEIDLPPRPAGLWTGIGTRKLNTAGTNAIMGIWTS